METVLVIGSNSFSGSDFIDLLLEEGNYKIIGISRSPEKGALFLPYLRHRSPNFCFFQVDLNKDLKRLDEILEEHQPSYIVNFAALSEVGPSWDHPDHWFQTNAVALTALTNLLKNKAYIKRYVHISSPEVYGTCEGIVKEDAPLNPSTPYAASKAAGDLSLFTFYKNYNFPLVMIRATNVYGAHQQLFKIIPRTVIFAKEKEKVPLHGGGVAEKSYIHIRDVSKGTLSAMKEGKIGEIYHFSPDQAISIRSLVELIGEKLGIPFSDLVKEAPERLGQDKAYIIDSSKARHQFGWKPKISIDQGIDEVIRWVNTYFDEIRESSLVYIHQQ